MNKEECEIETSKAIMEMRNHIAELEKEKAELKEENKKTHVLFADIIEAFTSCSYNDDFEMAQAGKEIYELFYGGKDPKEVFHNAEVPKSSRQLLKEAKEVIRDLLFHLGNTFIVSYTSKEESITKAEQFLKECE